MVYFLFSMAKDSCFGGQVLQTEPGAVAGAGSIGL